MAWTYAFDTATPAGTDAPATLDNDARTKALAIQERLNADHYFPLTGTAVSDTDAGKHRKVTAQAVLSAKPTLLTGEAALYTKTVSGVSEWFWEDSDGTEKQLTSGGALNITSSELLGILANATYFTAVDEAGTGTVDLIKAGKNEADDTDVAILPDETRLASNAAPTEDTQVPNKKYIDDQIATKALGTRTGNDEDSAAIVAGTTYQATGDGFLSAWWTSNAGGGEIILYSSSVSPPTTIIDRMRVSANDFSGKLSVKGFIKSGDYVKITSDAAITASWIPLGSGVLT